MRSFSTLLDRARSRMAGRDLRRLVPSDPGGPGYVAAFDAIIADGGAALGESHDGQPLYRSFDFCETVNLTRWTPCRNTDERWFRVLTCAAHLAARPLGEEAIPLNYTLVTLLVDSLGLEAGGARDAPIDLVPAVCRDLRASIEAGDGDPFAQESDTAFCHLAELLHGDLETEADRLCAELAAVDERASAYYLPGTFERNPAFADGEEFVWGLTVFDQLHPDWLVLVSDRFPTASHVQQRTKQRLADDGIKWASKPITLS